MAKSKLRPIEPLNLPDLELATVTGRRPDLRWVAPTDLLVDGTYQRELSRGTMRLLRRTIREFAWSRYKPPVAVEVDGKLHLLDGQHTAIAAATIRLPEIPVFVVDVPAISDRARAFVGHNTDRVTVTPIQLWQALVAAGDEDALDVANVCRRAGVVVRGFNQASDLNVGDTRAIGIIRQLVVRRGVRSARIVLEALVKAKRAPIGAAEILAAEHLLLGGGDLKPEALSRVIRMDGDDGIARATAKAKAERGTVWRAVAERWRAKANRS